MTSFHLFFFRMKIGVDLFFIAGVFFLSEFFSKRHMHLASPFFPRDVKDYLLLLTIFLLWLISTRICRLYDEFLLISLDREFLNLLKTILVQGFLMIILFFMVKEDYFSRFFIAVNLLLSLIILGLWTVVWRKAVLPLTRRSRREHRLLLIGGGKTGRRFAAAIQTTPPLGISLAGYLDSEAPEPSDPLWKGKISEVETILSREEIDEIVISAPDMPHEAAQMLIRTCNKYPVSLRLIPETFETVSSRFRISSFAGIPIVSLRKFPLQEFHWRMAKRSLDLLVTLSLFLLVFWWLWPIVALLIRWTSPGPVLFKQERWGIKNRRILCYKFRSMVAESRDVDENGRYQQAAKDDPRITRIGRFLRKSNLDELPQFLNVLKGEMSVVGPRPHPTPLNQESREKIDNYQLRHLIKPGITGWAQVNGYRGETKHQEVMKKRVEHDLWYIENWSLGLDIYILARTVWKMIRGDPNAY